VAVEYRILGPLEAIVDGQPVRLGGPRPRAVLAILLAHAVETLPASRLIDELWGEQPPETAANTLQGFVSELHKALGQGAIVTRGSGYAVALDPGSVDLERFERLAAEGSDALTAGRAADAAQTLGAALALWRGPALADLDEEQAARPIATRLDELRLTVLEKRIDADLPWQLSPPRSRSATPSSTAASSSRRSFRVLRPGSSTSPSRRRSRSASSSARR